MKVDSIFHLVYFLVESWDIATNIFFWAKGRDSRRSFLSKVSSHMSACTAELAFYTSNVKIKLSYFATLHLISSAYFAYISKIFFELYTHNFKWNVHLRKMKLYNDSIWRRL